MRIALIDGPLPADHPALDRQVLLRPGNAAGPEGAHAGAMADALLAHCPGARLTNLVVFGPGLTTSAGCVGAALEAARGSALVLCAFGMARRDAALAAAVNRLAATGAAIVAAAPARGGLAYPAAFDGVIAVQGDARCGPGDWSRLDLPHADFGACPALAGRAGIGGASVAAAHFAGLVAGRLSGGTDHRDLVEILGRAARYQGRECRTAAMAPSTPT